MAEKPKPERKPQRKPGKVKKQAERFIHAAREHGADETGEIFERAFGKLVTPRRRSSV